MLFTLEALNAKEGDSLLLHYGPSPDEPRLIVIDGGPPGVYKATLSQRLQRLRAKRAGNDDSLKIRLLMVSHIDGDHVAGVVELARAVSKADEQGAVSPWDVLSLWHNSFSDLVKPIQTSALGAQAAGVDAADLANAAGFPFGMQNSDSIAVIAGVAQGRELRNIAQRLAWNVNHGFGDLVTAPTVKKMDKSLEFVVLGPLQQQLDDLQNEWAAEIERLKKEKKLKPAEAQAQIAAFLDDTATNLSSIAVLARSGGKTMLLTGDARGDKLLDGLRAANLLTNDKIHVDLFKVPHHGSDRNVTEDFFTQVTADQYIISADGKHGNPDVPMLEWLTNARGNSEYTIHLTNPVPHALKALKAAKAKPGRRFEVSVRKDADLGVRVELGDALKD